MPIFPLFAARQILKKTNKLLIMKKYLLSVLLLAIISMPAFAEKDEKPRLTFKTEEVGGDAYYEEVVQAGDLSQEVLYKRAKDWVIANFKTGDNNINFDDKEFTITNSAAMKVEPKSFFTHAIFDGLMDFKFHVWVKDGKYKFRIDNISYLLLEGNENSKQTQRGSYSELKDNKYSRYLKGIAEEKLYGLAYVFKDAMKNEAKVQKKEDW